MYRRDFLKLGGLFSAAVMIRFNSLAKAVSFPVEVEAQGKLFRGTSDGKIYISADAGKSWQLQTNFGADVAILDLRTNFWGQLQTQLETAGYNFELVLAQTGKGWKTR
jgi:hypothetical protein